MCEAFFEFAELLARCAHKHLEIMTKEEFDAGIGAFYEKEAISKIYAVISPREEDERFIIANDYGELYQERTGGILIDQGRGKTWHYLPYASIIALTGLK